VTKELNGLKNETTKVAKKVKKSERRCMVADDISECDPEKLRSDFTALRSTYQERHGFTYDETRIGIEEEIQTDHKYFFRYFDVNKERVVYPSVMNFECQSGSGSQEICDLFAKFMERTYAIEPCGCHRIRGLMM
jgi:hypothetical protein